MLQILRSTIENMPRFWKRTFFIGFDVVALLAALWVSYAVRYGVWAPAITDERILLTIQAPIIAIPIFIRMGLYRAVIRYLPDRAIWTILKAMSIATAGWVILVFLTEMAGRGVVPRSVPFIYWAVGILFIGGSRFAAKAILSYGTGMRRTETPVFIYGTGEAAVQLTGALQGHGNRYVVGLLDDNPAYQGRDVAGIRVYSPSRLPVLIEQYGVKEVILSNQALSTSQRQDIVARLSGLGIKIRTLPDISDIVSGKYLVSQIREIDIDELLGRSFVPASQKLISEIIQERIVMVTGAGGSIGSELCRLIAKWNPTSIVLFEANEFALYRIDKELAALEGLKILPVLGSITDATRVADTITRYGVQVVFHAAAYKHVPLVEANVLEGIRNNVFGTQTVADIAFANGVENFVLISSDKAVRPTNVMGATKRWAEIVVRQKAAQAGLLNSGQRFCAVRFGNVLGSNGSVVPLFKEQIAHGGPVTLTDLDMTRYFMSIHEAAELIVQASALSQGGDIFLLEMGEPVRISDLARNMIQLAGFTVRDEQNPRGDIDIIVTGKRAGEKMFEELFYDMANALPTQHPKILRAEASAVGQDRLDQALLDLKAAIDAQDEAAARRILFDFIEDSPAVDTATPPSAGAADLD
jgi:FlaA1/EpsC-like NDP-sugar epimerase